MSARQVVRARLSSFFPLVGHRSPTSTCVLENTPVPDKYLNKIFSGSPQQVVAASAASRRSIPTDRFQTSRIQPFVNVLSSGFHSTPSGKVLEGFELRKGYVKREPISSDFFCLSPNSHRSGRISNESYSAVFKYFDLQFPPSTNCEGAGRIPDASVLHCQVLGTKFSIRNLGPYLRCLLRFYLEDCHSDDSGVRARTRAGPRAEIYERPVLVRF